MAPKIRISFYLGGDRFEIIFGFHLYSAEKTVEFKNIEITSGIGGIPGAGIENYGHLFIWDVSVFKNPFLPQGEYVIYNAVGAELTVKGSCNIKQ